MGIVQRISDGLVNLASGLGTPADKRTRSFHHLNQITPDRIDAAYRASWLVRKIVDLPALDMTRERRDWQAPQADIARLEAEEKRVQLWARVREALILGRLGGGAIILGVGNEDPALPLNPRNLRPGALRYIHVVSRWRLGLGPIVKDPASDIFGMPDHFTIGGAGNGGGAGGRTRIHPSRVVVFRGRPVPDLGVASAEQAFWGDSVIQSIDGAVNNADTATAGFASLIHEARLDTVSIPGLIDLVATEAGEQLLQKRVAVANSFKSIWNTRILDGGSGGERGEEWDTRQINWAGMPEVMNAFMGFVAGAADIPATRLLGRSPQGMNATGDGDLTNYYDRIQAGQDSDLRPQLELIDRVLIPSAGVGAGIAGADIWFRFPPLTTPTAREEADIFSTAMDAVGKLQGTGLVPPAALSRAVQTFMTERGYLPGLETALAAIPEAERFPDPDGGKATEKDAEEEAEAGEAEDAGAGESPTGKTVAKPKSRAAASTEAGRKGTHPFGDYNPNRYPAGSSRGEQFAPSGTGISTSLSVFGKSNAAAVTYVEAALNGAIDQRGVRLGELSPKATKRLAALGLSTTRPNGQPKSIAVDGSAVMHIRKHMGVGERRRGQKPITQFDIAAAHHLLNNGRVIRGIPAEHKGSPLIEAHTRRHGRDYVGVFAVRKHTVSLHTLHELTDKQKAP